MIALPYPVTGSIECSFPYTQSSNCSETYAEYYGEVLNYMSIIIILCSFGTIIFAVERLIVLYKYKNQNLSRLMEIQQVILEIIAISSLVICFIIDPHGYRGWVHPYISWSCLIISCVITIGAAINNCIKWINVTTKRRINTNVIMKMVSVIKFIKNGCMFSSFFMLLIPIADSSLFILTVLLILAGNCLSIVTPMVICVLCTLYIYRKLKIDSDTSPNQKHNSKFARRISLHLIAFILLLSITISCFIFYTLETINHLGSPYKLTDPTVDDHTMNPGDTTLAFLTGIPAALSAGCIYGLLSGTWKINQASGKPEIYKYSIRTRHQLALKKARHFRITLKNPTESQYNIKG